MSKGSYIPVYWSPDIAPDWNINPGVLTAVTDMYPSKRGTLKSYACTSNIGVSFSTTTYGTPLYGKILRDYNDTGHLIVGTTKRLMYCLDFGAGVAFQDKSLGGADYTTSTDWSMTTFGNYILAFSKENTPQVSTVSAGVVGTFANLAGSPPKAKVCVSQRGFVVAFDTNDGVDDVGDRWHCSAYMNHADWVPSQATQCATGYLRDTPGRVKAAAPMRDFIVAYKADSTYILEYVGPPFVWQSRCVSHSIGSASMHGVAVIGDIHYVFHSSGIYAFDGQSFTPLSPTHSTFLKDTFSSIAAYGTLGASWDEHEGTINWYIRNDSATTAAFTKGFSYNIYSQRHGWITTPWTSNTMTGVIQGSASDWGNWDALGGNDSAKLRICALGYSGTTATFQFASVLGTTCTATTGHMGNDTEYIQSLRITPRCYALTSLSSATDNNRDRIYDGSPTATTASENDERIDVLASNRWHQLTFTLSAAELAGLTVEGLKVSDD